MVTSAGHPFLSLASIDNLWHRCLIHNAIIRLFSFMRESGDATVIQHSPVVLEFSALLNEFSMDALKSVTCLAVFVSFFCKFAFSAKTSRAAGKLNHSRLGEKMVRKSSFVNLKEAEVSRTPVGRDT